MNTYPKSVSSLADNTEDQKAEEARNYFAVISTMMLQNRRYGKDSQNSAMSIAEYRVLLYIISQLKPNAQELPPIELNVKDYYSTIGRNTKNGSAYRHMRETLKKLSDRSEWIPNEKGGEFLGRWINKVQSEPRSGKFTIYLQDDMAPYLLNLKKQYTKFQNAVMFAMESKYSVMLYMLLKSYVIQNRGSICFDTDDLKARLDASQYKNYAHFRQFCLNPALEEINLYTELKVEAKAICNGKTVVQVQFTTENLEKLQDEESKQICLQRLRAVSKKYSDKGQEQREEEP